MLKQTLNKGISTPIAIGIVLILVIIVGTFTWLQYGNMWRETAELPEIEIPEKEEVADWETYMNEAMKFEIKYPNDWKMEEKLLNVNFVKILKKDSYKLSCEFQISLAPSGLLSSTLELHNKFMKAEDWQKEDIILNGISTIKISYPSFPITSRYFLKRTEEVHYLLLHDVNKLTLDKGTVLEEHVFNPECIGIFNQMLSTFGFIEEDGIVEVLLENLKEGENKVGEIKIELINPVKNGKLPSEVEIKPNFPGRADSGYHILYKGETVDRRAVGAFDGWITFDYEDYKYILPLEKNTGTAGPSLFSLIYVFNQRTKELEELELSKEDSLFSKAYFSFRDFKIIYYEEYLYGLFFDRASGGVGYKNSGIDFLAFKEGISTDEKSLNLGDYYWEKPFFAGVSLIEEEGKLYIEISDVEDGLNKYLLSKGNIITK